MTAVLRDAVDYLPLSIDEFLTVEETEWDLPWLRGALQAAVEVEMATLPPYLCAYWSIKDLGAPKSQAAARVLRNIVLDEMYHLGHACNMLVAFGGTPVIVARAPSYPGELPRGIAEGLTVDLECLSREYLRRVFLEIELPESMTGLGGEPAATIGAFYDAITRAILRLRPYVGDDAVRRQVEWSGPGSRELFGIRHWSSAIGAVELVKDEGEGNAGDPLGPTGQKAHYYAFRELVEGQELVRVGKRWRFIGPRVEFPDADGVHQMARYPLGGWTDVPAEVANLTATFRATYTTMLRELELAWAGTDGTTHLSRAIGVMYDLKDPAQRLMAIPIRTSPGNYGPDFRPV